MLGLPCTVAYPTPARYRDADAAGAIPTKTGVPFVDVACKRTVPNSDPAVSQPFAAGSSVMLSLVIACPPVT